MSDGAGNGNSNGDNIALGHEHRGSLGAAESQSHSVSSSAYHGKEVCYTSLPALSITPHWQLHG
jgi:hypothetical protein